MDNKAKRLQQVYNATAIVTLNVILLLLLIEFSVRLATTHLEPLEINSNTLLYAEGQEPFFEFHPFAAFRWIPNARFGRQTVNSQGFVSTREIPFHKSASELRIVTLGGSSTVGNGNTDEDTYPRVLERLLRNAYPEREVNVINAAAGGYSTIESLGYLQSRMIHYNPDIILIMHGWNDMYYFTRTSDELAQWRKDFNLQAMWNPSVATQFEDLVPWDVRYLSWSQLYLHTRQLLRRSSTDETQANVIERRYDTVTQDSEGNLVVEIKAVSSEAVDTYSSNLSQIINLCEQNGILCISILQPTLISSQSSRQSPMIAQAVQSSLLYHGFDFDTHIDAFANIYQINRDVFGSERVIDATVMNGQEEYFFDHIHQSPAGTQRLAEIIAAELVTMH